MKKLLTLLLTLALALSLVACGGQPAPANTPAPAPAAEAPAPAPAPAEAPAPAAPVAEEVKGVTVPAFSVAVNGTAVTNESMAAYPVYSVQATSVNSAGTESTTTYVGFAIKDVLEAAGLTEQYVWLEAAADDGYAVTFTGDIIYEDTTLLAVTRDGSAFSNAPWFAPCTDQVTGSYLKGMVTLLVNTTEGKPDIQAQPAQGGAADAPSGELPEILDRTDKVEFAPFSFKVNGEEVTNDTLEGQRIFKIDATSINKNGEASISGYTGYKLADVLAACGIEGYASVKAVANDGYETELSGELVESDYTLVAIEKDKETGEDGTVWLAPCSETQSKSYCKLVVEIVVE